MNVSDAPILIVDDSDADRFFLMRAFANSGIKSVVHALESGTELIRYLAGLGKYSNRMLWPLPRMIFVDLQMPAPNGLEVLQWKQERTDLPRILWVAMSNFSNVRTINEAYNAGANTFLTKPLDAADIRNLVEAFTDYWKNPPPH